MGSEGAFVAGVMGSLAGPHRPRSWWGHSSDRWIGGDLQYHPDDRTGQSDEYWISDEVGSGGQAAVYGVGGARRARIEPNSWVMRAWLAMPDAERRAQPRGPGPAEDPNRRSEVRQRQLRVNQLSSNRDQFPALPVVRESFLATIRPGARELSLNVDIVERASQPLAHRLTSGRSPNRSATAPMSAPEVAQAFAPLCMTLANLHERSIIHRDIGERNVLLVAGGSLRVNDWGSVAIAGDETMVIATQGASTVPPEYRHHLVFQRENDREVAYLRHMTEWQVEPPYDAWQVGRLMYVMLTGDKHLGAASASDPLKFDYSSIEVQSLAVAEVVRGLTVRTPSGRMELREAADKLATAYSPPSEPPPVLPHTQWVPAIDADEGPSAPVGGVAGSTRVVGSGAATDPIPAPMPAGRAIADLAAVGVTVEADGAWWHVTASPETSYRIRGVEKTVGMYRAGTVIEVGARQYVLGE